MRISDWSSDVCSSDLRRRIAGDRIRGRRQQLQRRAPAQFPVVERRRVADARELFGQSCAESAGIAAPADRKSVVKGKRVSVRVDLGGRRILKKKHNDYTTP